MTRPFPRLLVAVHNPAAIEVVRRQLDPHPIAEEDLDPVTPHLPGRVSKRLVTVVQQDAKHPVPKSLDHLALQLDLLFLDSDLDLQSGQCDARGTGGVALAVRIVKSADPRVVGTPVPGRTKALALPVVETA